MKNPWTLIALQKVFTIHTLWIPKWFLGKSRPFLRWTWGLGSKFVNAYGFSPCFMHFFTTQCGDAFCGFIKMGMCRSIMVDIFARSNHPYPSLLQPQITKKQLFTYKQVDFLTHCPQQNLKALKYKMNNCTFLSLVINCFHCGIMMFTSCSFFL